MKKTLLSLLSIVVLLVGCTQNNSEEPQNFTLTTMTDTLSHAVGTLVGIDAYYSDLSAYSYVIEEALDDVINGNKEKIAKTYAYLNAVDIINRAYAQIDNKLNRDLILASAKSMLARAKDSMNLENIRLTETLTNQRIVNYLEARLNQEHTSFMEKVDKMDGIQKSESGLRFIISKQGKTVGKTDSVTTNYTLYDYFGKILDSSNDGTFSFKMPDGVVPGFAEAVSLAGYGGKIKAWVPAELGYGEKGTDDHTILPGQVLVFDIEVLDK